MKTIREITIAPIATVFYVTPGRKLLMTAVNIVKFQDFNELAVDVLF
jgi:hypothetical protein